MKVPNFSVKITLSGFLAAIFCITIQADNRILIHLTHVQEKIRTQIEQEYYLENAKNHGIDKISMLTQQTPAQISAKLTKKELRKLLSPSLGGFPALYSGYLDISDPDGLITFPLRHNSPKLFIAITPEIKLVKAKENTFSYAEYIANATNPIELYAFEKKVDDKNRPYWDVQKALVPLNNKIDNLTIVILANPKNIFITEGHFITAENVQLVLPEISIVGNTDKEKIMLQILDIKQYFESITVEEKKVSDTSVQKTVTNL
ncbi:MAG: hypothetical protein ABH827_05945 [bacterium]